MTAFAAAPLPATATLHHLALLLIAARLAYAADPPRTELLSEIIKKVKTLPESVVQLMRGLTIHWNYFFFLSRLTEGGRVMPKGESKHTRLFVVGTSAPKRRVASSRRQVTATCFRLHGRSCGCHRARMYSLFRDWSTV